MHRKALIFSTIKYVSCSTATQMLTSPACNQKKNNEVEMAKNKQNALAADYWRAALIVEVHRRALYS